MGAVSTLKTRPVVYFQCLCGAEVPVSDDCPEYIDCQQCRQRWKRNGVGDSYEAVPHTCTQCDDGCGVYFNPGIPAEISMTGHAQSPIVERCDVCMRFPNDDAALDAVRAAWLKMQNVQDELVGCCDDCPFMRLYDEPVCEMLSGYEERTKARKWVRHYLDFDTSKRVARKCPLKEKSRLVRLKEKA